MGLGNDIRGQGVLDERDSIAQVELALFQSLNLNDVLAGRSLQRLDRGIEVTVFLLQLRKLRLELRLFLLCHNRRAAKPSASFPKFVIPGGKHLHELRKQRGTSKPMIIVPLFDFEVPEQTCRARRRNFKSAALALILKVFLRQPQWDVHSLLRVPLKCRAAQ